MKWLTETNIAFRLISSFFFPRLVFSTSAAGVIKTERQVNRPSLNTAPTANRRKARASSRWVTSTPQSSYQQHESCRHDSASNDLFRDTLLLDPPVTLWYFWSRYSFLFFFIRLSSPSFCSVSCFTLKFICSSANRSTSASTPLLKRARSIHSAALNQWNVSFHNQITCWTSFY